MPGAGFWKRTRKEKLTWRGSCPQDRGQIRHRLHFFLLSLDRIFVVCICMAKCWKGAGELRIAVYCRNKVEQVL